MQGTLMNVGSPALAADPGQPPLEPRAALNRPVVLGPDDRASFPEPPADIDVERDGIPHGKLDFAEYESKTVGTTRKMVVYLPPGYSTDRKYPVLYLLHGIAGTEHEWTGYCHAHIILDNLIADGKAVPMILVMPNGRAQKDDRPPENTFAAAPAFAVFERDLLDDLIPAVEARYSVQADREHRGIAGLSMGGGQTLNFGLGHPDVFGWIGRSRRRPNTKPSAELLPDPARARDLKLVWLACGSNDGLLNVSPAGAWVSQGVQRAPHLACGCTRPRLGGMETQLVPLRAAALRAGNGRTEPDRHRRRKRSQIVRPIDLIKLCPRPEGVGPGTQEHAPL
jgi:hypothetical protein